MGFLSWLMGMPEKRPEKPAAKKESREELIRRAMEIRKQKQKEFDKLDPDVRARLLRQAMGRNEPGESS